MAKRRPKLTPAQEAAIRKTESNAAFYRRAIAVKQGDETARSFREDQVRVPFVQEGDIVFAEAGVRPYVAAVDAIEAAGPIQGLYILRDEQNEDHFYPETMVVCVVRPFDPDAPVIEPEGDKPPWEVDE